MMIRYYCLTYIDWIFKSNHRILKLTRSFFFTSTHLYIMWLYMTRNPIAHGNNIYPFDFCRYLGMQVGYKVMGIFLLMMLGWKVQRTQEYSLEKRPEGLLWRCWESVLLKATHPPKVLLWCQYFFGTTVCYQSEEAQTGLHWHDCLQAHFSIRSCDVSLKWYLTTLYMYLKLRQCINQWQNNTFFPFCVAVPRRWETFLVSICYNGLTL